MSRSITIAGLFLTTIFAAGCGGSSAAPETVTQPLACATSMGADVACDLSCLYKPADAPAASSASYSISGVVKDFFSDEPIKDATVEVWTSGEASNTPDGKSGTTGADGAFAIAMSGVRGNVRAAFRVSNSSADYIDTYHYNVFVSADGSSASERIGVRDLTVQIILGLFNLAGDPAAGHITGRFSDCSANRVANGIMRLYAAPHECGKGGEELPVIIGYFDGEEFPDPMQRSLNKDGLFLAANVKSNQTVAEIWGSLKDGENASLLGCGPLSVAPGSISILSLDPYPKSL